MGYLQALRLMVKAYKAAKGTMPKGLDLLKLKMRARQKAIDSKKVIQFPKDRITDPFKPRPQGIEKLIKKGDVKIGKAPKTTKVKEPVDPKLIMQESEKQTLARMRKENKEAIKRFKEKMDKPRDGKAIGGYITKNVTPQPNDPKLQNLLDVYESNPTLQSQMTADEYLMQTYRPSPSEPQTYAEMTQQQPAAGIPAVKPIRPIIPVGSESDDDGGGITKGFTKGYSSANFGLGPDKDVVDYEAEAYKIGRTPFGTASQIITGIPSLSKTAFQFVKGTKDKTQKMIQDYFARKAEEERIRQEQEKARLADQLARQMDAVYYDNPGATFTGGRYDGAGSRSAYESNPTGFSGSS